MLASSVQEKLDLGLQGLGALLHNLYAGRGQDSGCQVMECEFEMKT